MAYVVKSNGENLAFGVSQAVGQGKSNLWTDCMLVLYLLNRIMIYGAYTPTDNHFYPRVINPNKDYKDIKLISNVVLAFQTYESKRGVHLKTDGRVHRASPWFGGSKLYTIQHLNTVYKARVIGLFGVEANPIEMALDDHEMPVLLRGQLIASSVFEGVL